MPDQPDFVLRPIVLRLIPGGKCHGCGRIGRVDQASLLCYWCAGLKIITEDRKHKLDGTMYGRFAHITKRIREQLKEFSQPAQ